MPHPKTILILSCAVLLLFVSCNSNDPKKTTNTAKDTTAVKKAMKTEPKIHTRNEKPPIINIVDTVAPKRIVVYMKDSAATTERISIKLGQIYGVKLLEVFKKNGLKATGPPMAWYTTQKPPFFFEAGIPVNKKPGKPTPGVNVKELGADSVAVAHFYGPYDLLHVGYDALREWMKDHQRRATDAPYEIYITDPLDKKGKPVDPYKIQTDIVFPKK